LERNSIFCFDAFSSREPVSTSLENALNGVSMRKPVAASAAARKASVPSGSRDNAPVEVVCMALALALVVLAFRIASVW
jgi:hypothetical protein